MELVTVKIRGTVVTARYGTLTAGDILRTDASYARHLVDDCNAATYADAQPAQKDEPKAAPEAQPEAGAVRLSKPRRARG